MKKRCLKRLDGYADKSRWPSDAAALRHVGHRGRRGAHDTADNLALPAVGIGLGALIRPSLTPPTVRYGRLCGGLRRGLRIRYGHAAYGVRQCLVVSRHSPQIDFGSGRFKK